jgi:hypothetical protein
MEQHMHSIRINEIGFQRIWIYNLILNFAVLVEEFRECMC